MSRIALPLLFAAIVAGCVQPHRYAFTPQTPPACRTAMTADNEPASVEWIVSETDRQTLDDWCRTVGPAVVSRPAGLEPPARVDDLVVASWNVEVGGGDLDALLDRLLDSADPRRAVVVLLQEAYRASPLVPPLQAGAPVPHRIAAAPPTAPRRSVIDVARRRGLSFFYVPSMRNGRGDEAPAAEDRGNAIVSTLPLHDLSAIELPFESQRRVVAGATVSLPDGSGGASALRVVSAHLDARASWRRGVFLWLGRARQARALVDALGRGDGPMVLGGDFNTWLGELEPAVRRTRSRFPQTPPSHTHTTFPLVGPIGVHLDHLFFNLPDGWRADVSRMNQRWGSDHYPMLGSIATRFGTAATP